MDPVIKQEHIASVLGDAMRTGVLHTLVERVESYEAAFLRQAIEDPSMSKDFMFGFVSALRNLITDLRQCEQYATYEAGKAEEKKPGPEFVPPGGGPDRGQ